MTNIEAPTRKDLVALISPMDNVTLGLKWEQLRKEKKLLELLEEVMKESFEQRMGDQTQLVFSGDYGVFKKISYRYEVPIYEAERVIQDQDLLSEITKVDMTKAKEVLTGELFKELESKRVVAKEVTQLMTGKLKNI